MSQATTAQEYVSGAEAARLLGLDRYQLYGYVRRGRIPANLVTYEGRKFTFRRGDIPAIRDIVYSPAFSPKPAEVIAEEMGHLRKFLGEEHAIRRLAQVYGMEVRSVVRALERCGVQHG